VAQQFGLLLELKKTARSKHYQNVLKFAQSGHPDHMYVGNAASKLVHSFICFSNNLRAMKLIDVD
jgi:hypothetical protein